MVNNNNNSSIVSPNPGNAANQLSEKFQDMLIDNASSKLASLLKENSAQGDLAISLLIPQIRHLFPQVIDPREAIQEETIGCCFCGHRGRMLTEDHLSLHGLNKSWYLQIYNYPPDTALMSNELRQTRSKDAIKRGFGKKKSQKEEIPPEQTAPSEFILP